jgi:hypothetical protein
MVRRCAGAPVDWRRQAVDDGAVTKETVMSTAGKALDDALSEFRTELRREIKADMVELMNAQTERLAAELREILGKPNITTGPREPRRQSGA